MYALFYVVYIRYTYLFNLSIYLSVCLSVYLSIYLSGLSNLFGLVKSSLV